jgi:hypothetical protein
VLIGLGRLEVGVVVWTIDIVSGLFDCQLRAGVCAVKDSLLDPKLLDNGS